MKTILIVDDVAPNRRLLRAVLEAEGFDIVEAGDGLEALGLLAHDRVDAIISDVLMPNMDGFRFCLELRKDERFASMPVLIYTSTYNSPADRQLAITAGADAYLVKPAPVSVIRENLLEAKEKASARRGRMDTSQLEVDVIKQYNAALVTKLEERNEELSRANAGLRESEERFRQLAESIREVFWLTNPSKSEMLYVSPAYEAIWGRSCSSLIAAPRTWMDAVHPDDRARVERDAQMKQHDGSYDEEYRIVRPDGAIRWIRDRAFPVKNAAGKIYRLAGVAEDITERKHLEEQFRQAQKMEAIGQLSGGVAHDFNNLLAVIQGRVSLVQCTENLSPGVEEALVEVMQATARAANLTRQLLAFSRKQMMELAVVDLNVVVANLSKMLHRILGEDITVTLKCAPDRLTVQADVGMIEQVLMNLAVNSRDAMPHGGRLVIATSLVEIDEPMAAQRPHTRAGEFAALMVTDTGSGIPPELIARIFEPFFTTKDVGKGTGLGLAIVYGIVQQHRGWIDVESTPGRGTTFSIFLPLHVDTAATMKNEPAVRRTAHHGNETILVVEDEAAVRRVVQIVLSKAGFRVIEAANGPAALDVWKSRANEIDLLLTDLVMPDGVSGTELAARMLRDRPQLAVVYTSGYSRDTAGIDFQLKEGENFVAKPFEIDLLTATIRRSLDERQADSRPA